MPLCVEGSDEAFHDCLLTAFAAGGILLIITLATEGLVVFLVETFVPKLPPAESTEEMFGMPRPVQCSHHTLQMRTQNTGKCHTVDIASNNYD